jgi:aspartate racemase
MTDANIKQTKPKKRIGIIGGLGPRASAYFYKLIINYCSKKFGAALDSDFPSIILFSLSSSGMAETGVANQTVLISDLQEAFDCFLKANVDVIAIACNSVFAYYKEIVKQSHTNIINLPDEVASYLFTRSIKSVTILGSRGLIDEKVYDPYLFRMKIVPRYPDFSTQQNIDAWIFEVMRGNYNTQTTISFEKVIEEQLKYSDAVLIACSELSVLTTPFLLREKVFDSMYILAERTINYTIEEQ